MKKSNFLILFIVFLIVVIPSIGNTNVLYNEAKYEYENKNYCKALNLLNKYKQSVDLKRDISNMNFFIKLEKAIKYCEHNCEKTVNNTTKSPILREACMAPQVIRLPLKKETLIFDSSLTDFVGNENFEFINRAKSAYDNSNYDEALCLFELFKNKAISKKNDIDNFFKNVDKGLNYSKQEFRKSKDIDIELDIDPPF